MTEATSATARDFEDVGSEFGDDAIREAVNAAGPKTVYPPGFTSRPNGIYYDEGGDAGAIRIAGPIEILAQTRNGMNSSWGVLLKWSDDDGNEHRWAMPLMLLAGDCAELRSAFLDRGLYLAPGTKARQRLAEFLGGVKIDARARAVDRVGWCDDAFALPDRTIGETLAQRVIYQGPAALDHPYLQSGTLDDWKRKVGALACGNGRLIVAISAALVGPLLSLVDDEGGGLHYRGPSSIGKSTALEVAASVWGKPSEYVRPWRATANGLEGVAVLHSETFLALDELAQLDPKDAGSVAYLLANGQGKARAGRTGAARQSSRWKVFFLSSGEIGLAELAGRDGRGARRSAAGEQVRILDVEADAGKSFGLFETLNGFPCADAFARAIKDNASRVYGTAGPAFVEIIAERRDKTRAYIRQAVNDFVGKNCAAASDGQVTRAARKFALIAAAGELASLYGVVPWTAGAASAAATMLLTQWISGRGGAGASEDRNAIAQVRSFLEEHGSSRFQPMEQIVGFEDRTIHRRAGFWRSVMGDREYLIFAEAWKNDVSAGMDAKRVAAVLASRGFLQTDAHGKHSVSVSLPGLGKTRCYIVKPEIFGATND